MFPNSIRVRITLWYLAVLAIVLSVCAVIVYELLAKSRMDRLEARLEVAVHVIAASLEHEIEEHAGVIAGEASFRRVLGTIHHLSFPDLSLNAARDSVIVGEKADSSVWKLPLADLDRAKAALPAPAAPADSKLAWSNQGRRFLAMRIYLNGAHSYLFLASASELQAQADNLAIRNAFLIGLPISLLLAAGGGWWLARASFAPIREIMDAVDGITASALERRLPVPASGDELARLAVTFNDLLERLQHSFELQRQFMADASHELRTPIFIAHAAGEVALDAPQRTPEEYREALQVIDAQMKRLGRVVQDMFLLARADSGGVPLRISKFYLEEVIADCARSARLMARNSKIRVEVEAAGECCCQGDETMIRQATLILLDNAIKYSPENSVVRVSLDTTDSGNPCYRIVVSDSGPGIDSDLHQRIFERFFRADKSRSRSAPNSGGAGLGLPIARWIAVRHGGTLELVRSDAAGSTFCLMIRASTE